jgi:hypothetical protein
MVIEDRREDQPHWLHFVTDDDVISSRYKHHPTVWKLLWEIRGMKIPWYEGDPHGKVRLRWHT